MKIKEQSGLCWAFASVKSMETNLLLKTGYDEDLSEMHVGYIASMYNIYTSLSSGANWLDFEEYILNNKGPVREETVPYKRITSENEYDYLDQLQPIAFVNEIVNFPSISKRYQEYTDEELRLFREKVKKHIIKNGSIYCVIYSPTGDAKYWSDENYALYFDGGERLDWSRHAVSIIGWDDNYSKNNFNENCRPEHDGAYIALNSWGEEWGDNGIFYISYDDIEVESDMNGIVSSDIDQVTKQINFEDENLYKKVKRKLGKQIIKYNDQEKNIEVSSLTIDKFTDLFIEKDDNIHDLSGIENFTGLTYLEIMNSDILNFDKIKDLINLKNLTIYDCNLENIDFLVNCNQIVTLNLSKNKIKNIDSIKNLENLFILYLIDNQIENIDALKELTNIIELNLSKNNISSISDLKNLKEIEVLGLNGNNIAEIGDLDNFKKLGYLDIGNNNVRSIEVLNHLNNISSLDISNNINIMDLNILESIPNLYYLNISGIQNITNVDRLNISYLELNNVEITENIKRQLNSLVYLEQLSLQDCNITDASFLSNINCQNINLSYNTEIRLETIPRNLNGMLDLSDCDITSIEGLRESNISYLNVANNRINNIDAVEEMSLMGINLANNGITDERYESMLSKLQNIYDVVLEGNNISEEYMGNYVLVKDIGNIQINEKNYFSFDSILKDEDMWSYMLEQLNSSKYRYSNDRYPYNQISISNGDINYDLKCITIDPNDLGKGKTVINLSYYDKIILKYNVVNESIIDEIIPINLEKNIFVEGENFDLLGSELYIDEENQFGDSIRKKIIMRILYKSGYYFDTTDFSILNGNSLQYNQKNVTAKINHLNLFTNIPIKVYRKSDCDRIECDDALEFEEMKSLIIDLLGNDAIFRENTDEYYFMMKKEDILSIDEIILFAEENVDNRIINKYELNSLRPLEKFINIKSIIIDCPTYTGAYIDLDGIQYLQKLEELKANKSEYANVQIGNFKLLNGLNNLKKLDLDGTNIIASDEDIDTINYLINLNNLNKMKVNIYCIVGDEDTVKLPQFIWDSSDKQCEIAYMNVDGEVQSTNNIELQNEDIVLDKSISLYPVGIRKITIKFNDTNRKDIEYNICFRSEECNINDCARAIKNFGTYECEYGKKFDLDNVNLEIKYNWGIKEVAKFEDEMIIENINNKQLGEQTLKLRYKGIEIPIHVKVIPAVGSSEYDINYISINLPSKVLYEINDPIDLSGGYIIVKYNSGKESKKILTKDLVSGYDSTNPGIQEITIKYKENNYEKEEKFNVTIIDNTIQPIEYYQYNEIKCIDINVDTDLEQIENKISNILKIQDKYGNDTQDTKYIITTGTKITRIDGTEYIVVIKGDTNGDGHANIKDMIIINNYRLYNTTANFDEIYRLAGDINKDNNLDIKDMIMINNYRLYGTNF